jgi:hypothetical protein
VSQLLVTDQGFHFFITSADVEQVLGLRDWLCAA